MSKEYLEVKPEDIANLLYEVYNVPNGICEHIKNMVQRLESLDNSKPSKALKTLEVLDNTISPLLEPILAKYEDDLSDKITANYFALKQTLIKAQKQEKDIIHYKGTVANLRRDNALLKELNAEKKKVLEIIKEKEVSIFQLNCCKNVNEYNDLQFKKDKKLTKEEFDTLKRYFR